MILLQALFLRAIQTNIASMVRVLQKNGLVRDKHKIHQKI